MTKAEFEAKLAAVAGDCAYGKEVAADLVDHFDETGKYAQTAKDRLDERLGTLKGWEKKHEEEGDYAKASEEAKKIACVLKFLDAVK
ncbi:hypothetical protein IM774_04290 [Erysipelotrichaceae bacterium RD49]|nr:hypothetical protein [Erysipelotrichaceae bacterium RD49]